MDRKYTNTTVKVEPQAGGEKRLPSPWESAFKVPLAWAGVSGVLTGLFAAMLIYTMNPWGAMLAITSFLIGVLSYVLAVLSGVYWKYSFAIGIPVAIFIGFFIWLMPGWAAAITASVSMMLIVWFIKLENVAIPALERATGVDWNRDGLIGIQEKPEVMEYRLTVDHPKSGRTSYLNVTTTEAIARAFCEEALADDEAMNNPFRPFHTTGEAWMEQHGVPRGTLRKIREQMISLEYAKWDGAKNEGWSLTPDGRTWIQNWLSQLPSPTE